MIHPQLAVWPLPYRGLSKESGFVRSSTIWPSGARLTGWVVNESDAVRIEVQGPRRAVDGFVESLRSTVSARGAD